MKIHNIEQQSEEWFEVRKGKMTASHAQEIASNGKGLDTYIHKLMSGFYSLYPEEHYSNADTERGNLLEPIAIKRYEEVKKVTVKVIGFYEIDKYKGFSPDGLVGRYGGVEAKCKNNTNHFKQLIYKEKEIESKYVWQIQMSLMLSKKKWWDFVAYNPNFKKDIYIKRFYPDPVAFEKLKIGLLAGKTKIVQLKKLYKSII